MQLNTAQAAPVKPSQKSSEYISVVETAKLVRKLLKRLYPDHKFSVRSDKYAGGASINITAPVDLPDEDVDAINEAVRAFSSRGFDGMIDMTYGKTSWLLGDGSVAPAHCSGTTGSGGLVPEYDYPAPTADARLVHFGSSHIFVQRAWN